ncbi:hypothetical protein J7L18_01990 [Candidatus Bathyarchaeota archaeon]|nr:hypothetical protein [Candidatus Bathyarchaeota archaeon]
MRPSVIPPATADFLELEVNRSLPKDILVTASGLIETPPIDGREDRVEDHEGMQDSIWRGEFHEYQKVLVTTKMPPWAQWTLRKANVPEECLDWRISMRSRGKS